MMSATTIQEVRAALDAARPCDTGVEWMSIANALLSRLEAGEIPVGPFVQGYTIALRQPGASCDLIDVLPHRTQQAIRAVLLLAAASASEPECAAIQERSAFIASRHARGMEW
jgi:hypothetical protein